MKKFLPFAVLLLICLGCVFQSKTTTDESNEKKSNNQIPTKTETANTTNNSSEKEKNQPQIVEKNKVDKTPETKSHEDLHNNEESENNEDIEGDDENPKVTVKFAKGETSAYYQDGLVRGERRTYVVEARKGQTMAVRVEAEEKNAVFTITKNGKIVDTAEETEKWVGTLPSDGKYEIEVGGTRGNASYAIEISVEN